MTNAEFVVSRALIFLLLFALGWLLLLLKRKLQGRDLFTDADCRLLFGMPKETLLRPGLWRRAAVTGFVALMAGFNIGVLLLIHGFAWFTTAWALSAAAVVILLPRFLK